MLYEPRSFFVLYKVKTISLVSLQFNRKGNWMVEITIERSNEVAPSAVSVVVLTSLSSCSRLGSTLSSTATAGGGVLVSAPSAPPPTMPVFPLRPSAPAAQYSPYSPSRFHIDKRCRHRCSWKCCSIALILLSVALTAMLAYFGGQFF